jgi:hypothetical protein
MWIRRVAGAGEMSFARKLIELHNVFTAPALRKTGYEIFGEKKRNSIYGVGSSLRGTGIQGPSVFFGVPKKMLRPLEFQFRSGWGVSKRECSIPSFFEEGVFTKKSPLPLILRHGTNQLRFSQSDFPVARPSSHLFWFLLKTSSARKGTQYSFLSRVVGKML